MQTSLAHHCADLFTWLEDHMANLYALGPSNTTIKLPVLRLCNGLLKRLGRGGAGGGGAVGLVARMLMFTAALWPLDERSGLNISVGEGQGQGREIKDHGSQSMDHPVPS